MAESLTIKDRLQVKFDQEAQKLSPYRKRIIVFRYDENKEFIEELKDLNLTCNGEPVKILIVESFFETKYILEHKDKDSHYLIYLPFARPKDWKNNWLIDIELYSSEFRADLLGMALEECNIDISLYNKLLKQQNFFSNRTRKDKLAKTLEYKSIATGMSLEMVHLCMLLVCSGSKMGDIEDVIINVFEGGFDEEENKKRDLINKTALTDTFRKFLYEDYGYKPSGNPTLLNFWFCLFFGAIHYECPTLKFLNKFKDYWSEVDNAKAYATIKKWINTKGSLEIYMKICDIVFEKKKITFESFKGDYEDIDEIIHLTIAQKFENLILKYCSEKIGLSDNKKLISVIEYRKQNSPWYEYFTADYEIIRLRLELSSFVNNPIFDSNSFDEMWNYYINVGYQADTLYRRFINQYNQSTHQDYWLSLYDLVNNKYANWARGLNDRWYKILEDEKYTENWGKSNLNKEWNFWNDYITPHLGKRKSVVIISDAFRYEAAKELQEDLEKATKGSSELNAIHGCLPSYTKLGMASLLPHDDFKASFSQGKDDYSIKGISTESLLNRQKILGSFNEKYTAVKRTEFEGKSDDEKRSFISNYDVVYIYHNIVDINGEHTDPKTLPTRIKECIIDIKKIIKKCSDYLNVYQIFVTADHGFLYQLRELEEIDKTKRNKDALIKDTRFEITNKSDFLKENDLTVSLSYIGSDDFIVSTPRSDLRYARQGIAKQYVHGGAALQEIVVPVLSYHHKKEKVEYNTYAELILLNPPKEITSNAFYLDVFQTTEIKDKIKPGKYRIVVKDVNDPGNTGTEITYPYIFDADKTSAEPDTRKTRIELTQKPNMSTKGTTDYYIIILPEEDKDNNSYWISYKTSIKTFIQDEGFNFGL